MLQSRCWQALQSHLETLQGEGSASKLTHKVADRIVFLTSCWTEGLNSSEGLSFSLVADQGLLSVPCHVDLSML